ncbi:phosphoglucosamine mutase [Magnetospirillum gryphiswaldense]|uniref:Phosphoglucosamine mutase n=2 Tax=Magnetospirillum gryphiswaldense TaxID=55518 RepID=V6EXK4_MAGGM|nr:phosphoglucosamine mutase [Magnetospirillum gryphiswaldense]AVM73223.1 Phosphoglucosamine mutase [Magnetospirillum gryphiswaldense MSR-1]AVM77126.1 Phosphoglucosamine mutase [Magnetospirillum gryphiswaldense]CAM74772.1 Phosphoglucosamine mutase [Magnetospirillum gryphiswaldense MSR-1]CDK98005.1 phosphoglucosamine mutase [Magnetospirillum gryphiswaldense MSR-1 v2]
MTRKLFGTDGIRGTANIDPMTAEMALKLGMAAGRHFTRGEHRHMVVIGKDTRLSGYLLEPALTAGFIAVGMDVVLLGPLPTPAVAMLTRSLRADLGVMISASHNAYQDNGIKLFGPDGFKLSDEDEIEIEHKMFNGLEAYRVGSDHLGKAKRLDDAVGRYIEYAKSSFPRGLRLDGLKIVVDCANGAAYKVAPTVLWELGAEVIPLAVSPDGFNINKDCGSLHTQTLQTQVVAHGAHLGIALDGDADRLVLCDEKGTVIDGDQVMGLIGLTLAKSGKLTGGGIVATVMSNMGLEKHLAGHGLHLHRTNVGDRYVLERMRRDGFNVGGEQSGHIILSDHSTTGDGLVAALQVLAALVEADKPASQVLHLFDPFPQVLKNVRVAGKPDAVLALDGVQAAIAAGEARLNGTGRVLIRKSGTEPLIRVMAEGEDKALVDTVVDDIVATISAAAG